jgi:hypothetical protein
MAGRVVCRHPCGATTSRLTVTVGRSRPRPGWVDWRKKAFSARQETFEQPKKYSVPSGIVGGRRPGVRTRRSLGPVALSPRKVVGAEGFEPPTLWSQTRCATRLRYAPTCRLSHGAADSRTCTSPLAPKDPECFDSSSQPDWPRSPAPTRSNNPPIRTNRLKNAGARATRDTRKTSRATTAHSGANGSLRPDYLNRLERIPIVPTNWGWFRPSGISTSDRTSGLKATPP